MGRRRGNTKQPQRVKGPSHNSEGPPDRDSLTEATFALWQPRTTRPLTTEDAREIAENVVGFFQLLHEWDLADRRIRKSQHANSQKRVNDAES
jgi:hypothetical protein